jgi:hypothetical protein
MNVEGFIAEFRRVMRDPVAPFLWCDGEIVAYLNDAINEACERALLIEDRTTPDVCSIALQAGVPDYLLHDSVLSVKRAVFRGCPLQETSVERLDGSWSNWEARQGQPREFIFSDRTGLRLVPTPNADEELALTVYRLPLEQLSEDIESGEPEISAKYHMRLLPWVYRCAYLKTDADTFDKGAADRYEAIFNGSFGLRVDANVQRKQRDRRPAVVKFRF